MTGSAPSTHPKVFVADRLALTVSATMLAFCTVSRAGVSYLIPSASSGSQMAGVGSIVSLPNPVSVGLFELAWVVSMVAMMFPAMIPVVVFYNRVPVKAEPAPKLARVVGTPLFLSGYLGAYAVLGLLAFVGIYGALRFVSYVPTLYSIAPLGPTLVLLIAGLYQLSPLKIRSLQVCISPMNFFAVHSKRGLLGSLRMGFVHWGYCVGCCWAYMLVMLAVAAMSLPVMIILAGAIAVEKIIARGSVWFNRGVAGFLLALSVVVIIAPDALTAL